mmetsp:Transcript_19817/g.62783  ORF Transcript_19817/g.62783 Transcript_19817/m.62783 type:complete len:333 (-) Transcript_19817:39-1037(-)
MCLEERLGVAHGGLDGLERVPARGREEHGRHHRLAHEALEPGRQELEPGGVGWVKAGREDEFHAEHLRRALRGGRGGELQAEGGAPVHVGDTNVPAVHVRVHGLHGELRETRQVVAHKLLELVDEDLGALRRGEDLAKCRWQRVLATVCAGILGTLLALALRILLGTAAVPRALEEHEMVIHLLALVHGELVGFLQLHLFPSHLLLLLAAHVLVGHFCCLDFLRIQVHADARGEGVEHVVHARVLRQGHVGELDGIHHTLLRLTLSPDCNARPRVPTHVKLDDEAAGAHAVVQVVAEAEAKTYVARELHVRHGAGLAGSIGPGAQARNIRTE